MRRCYYCDEPFDDDVETCPLCEHPIVIDERLQTECETRRVSFDPGSDPEGPEILDIRCPYCTRDLLRDRYDVAPYCSYCGEISAEFAQLQRHRQLPSRRSRRRSINAPKSKRSLSLYNLENSNIIRAPSSILNKWSTARGDGQLSRPE